MRTSYEEDLLTIVALTRLHKQFEDSYPALASHAKWLAVGIGERYGVDPDEALTLLEIATDHAYLLE